ncbi:MAG: TetR/AcrR family transcriptional regulator [Candidatus Delongbacteria bacterium]|nr:TetR/AcrR family transcriptional regulator [Candidatus Delongbacteria bacterium]MBN2836559.1 TetR/AcrR family transcriptional regulator [Candidatus Delongbacteria bacterium]
MQIKKNELREKILQLATVEFLDNGYQNASIRKIAGLCEISPGNLYTYFSSKEDLYINVTLSYNNERLDYIHREMDKGKTSYEKLWMYCKGYYDYAIQNAEKFKLFMYYELNGLDESKFSQSTNEDFIEKKRNSIKVFHEIFTNCEMSGMLRSQIDFRTFIVSLTMSVRIALNEVVVLKYKDKKFYFDYVKIILNGLLKMEEQ